MSRRKTAEETDAYIRSECERQWNECQAETCGEWQEQTEEVQKEYYKDMKRHLTETGAIESFG